MIGYDKNTGEHIASYDICGRVIETKTNEEELLNALSERMEPLGKMELMGIDPENIYCYDCMAMESYF